MRSTITRLTNHSPRCTKARSFNRATANIAFAAALLALLSLSLPLAAFAKKTLPSQPIDINKATIRQLEQLPGIGPSRAEAIVEFRLKSGPFHKVDDLLAVPGISKQRMEKLRPYVRIGGPPVKKPVKRAVANGTKSNPPSPAASNPTSTPESCEEEK